MPANSSVLFLIYARLGDIEAIKNLIKKEEEADFYNQITLARRFSSSSCVDRAAFDKEIKNDAGLSALAIAMRNKDMMLATYLLREHKLDPESTNVVSFNQQERKKETYRVSHCILTFKMPLCLINRLAKL